MRATAEGELHPDMADLGDANGVKGESRRKQVWEGRQPPAFLAEATGHLLVSYNRKYENHVCMKENEEIYLIRLNNGHFRHQLGKYGQI